MPWQVPAYARIGISMGHTGSCRVPLEDNPGRVGSLHIARTNPHAPIVLRLAADQSGSASAVLVSRTGLRTGSTPYGCQAAPAAWPWGDLQVLGPDGLRQDPHGMLRPEDPRLDGIRSVWVPAGMVVPVPIVAGSLGPGGSGNPGPCAGGIVPQLFPAPAEVSASEAVDLAGLQKIGTVQCVEAGCHTGQSGSRIAVGLRSRLGKPKANSRTTSEVRTCGPGRQSSSRARYRSC